jgi:hypothetical protein
MYIYIYIDIHIYVYIVVTFWGIMISLGHSTTHRSLFTIVPGHNCVYFPNDDDDDNDVYLNTTKGNTKSILYMNNADQTIWH